jgi:acetyl esterase/lipase
MKSCATPQAPSRREALRLAAAAAAWNFSTACKSMGPEILDLPAPPSDARLPYGPDPSQFGDLRMPRGAGPHPVAIVLHGGFWRAERGLEYAGHMCAAFAHTGIASWNLEYRRIGNPGGGWPGTFLDVALGADHLRTLAKTYPLDLKRVIAVGHSSGGHLALWLAARPRIPAGGPLAGPGPITLRGAAPIAGVVDLRRGWELRLGRGVVGELMGGPPEKLPEQYHAGSPIELVPIGVTVRLLHGTDDSIVPIEISNNYQKAAVMAGDDARLVPLPGADHFLPVDPRSIHWPLVEKTAQSLL